jgi:hypothetical protein
LNLLVFTDHLRQEFAEFRKGPSGEFSLPYDHSFEIEGGKSLLKELEDIFGLDWALFNGSHLANIRLRLIEHRSDVLFRFAYCQAEQPRTNLASYGCWIAISLVE